MEKPKFRRPEEMGAREPREPVSARLKEGTKKILSDIATKEGLSLDRLIANICDDYIAWLDSSKKNRK